MCNSLPKSGPDLREGIKRMGIADIISLLGGLAFFLFGMTLLGDGLKKVAGSKLETVLGKLTSNPIKGVLLGALVTAVIQSSSASIGILQALSATGAISYEVAIPMVLGMCIGACVPVLLSAIGANANGKRTAVIYLYFNIVGSVLFMLPFYLIHAFMEMQFMAGPADAFGIAVFNTVFKVGATLVQLPFTALLVKLACATIKEERSEDDEEFEENLLDERFLRYPPLALEQSGRTVDRMAAAAVKNLNRSIELFTTFNGERYDKILARENVVDRYEDKLGSYLFHLNSQGLNERETLVSSHYLHCLTDLERISDHAVNLANLAKEMDGKGVSFSPDGLEDMNRSAGAVLEIVALAQEALTEADIDTALRVEPLEEVISTLLEGMKLRHIRRLQSGVCTLEMGFIINDLINNFERVAAHCSNVALAVLELRYADLQFHNYARGVRQGDQPEFRKWLAYYQEKYLEIIKA